MKSCLQKNAKIKSLRIMKLFSVSMRIKTRDVEGVKLLEIIWKKYLP